MRALPPGFLCLIAACSSSTLAADEANPLVKAAQDQAAIAKANADIATANATIAGAAATAELALQKAAIENTKSAFADISGKDMRLADKPAAPAINATYYRLLADQISGWLDKNDEETPVHQLAQCSSVVLANGTLEYSVLVFHATDERLRADWKELALAISDLEGKPVETAGVTPAAAGLLPGVAAVSGAANLFMQIATAAKRQTALDSHDLTPAAEKLAEAIVLSKIPAKPGGEKIYEPNLGVDFISAKSGNSGECKELMDSAEVGNVMRKAACVAGSIDALQALVNDAGKKLKPVPPKKPDPQQALRTKFENYSKLVAQAKSHQAALITPSADNAMPLTSALKGEYIHAKLEKQDACIFSIKAITSDVDAVVRDGTFSSYKLSLAMTTNLSWSVSDRYGEVKHKGFKSLSSTWTRQELDEPRRSRTPIYE